MVPKHDPFFILKGDVAVFRPIVLFIVCALNAEDANTFMFLTYFLVRRYANRHCCEVSNQNLKMEESLIVKDKKNVCFVFRLQLFCDFLTFTNVYF